MESVVLVVLVVTLVTALVVARRQGWLSGSAAELRDAERAEEAARAAPHVHGPFPG